MYRDAIDQRTPLTYYIVAACFWLCGANNMWAIHALLAGMITATAMGVFLIGRRWRGPAAGGWQLSFSAPAQPTCFILVIVIRSAPSGL